jgi:hypothetical protein
MSSIAKSGPERGTSVGMASARFEASVKPTEARKEAGRNCVGVRHRCAFGISQKCIRRVGPTHTREQNDCGQDLAICRHNGVPTTQLLVTESAQVDVTPARNEYASWRGGGADRCALANDQGNPAAAEGLRFQKKPDPPLGLTALFAVICL